MVFLGYEFVHTCFILGFRRRCIESSLSAEGGEFWAWEKSISAFGSMFYIMILPILYFIFDITIVICMICWGLAAAGLGICRG